MSVAALKEIIDLVKDMDIKNERKNTTDRFTNSYFLSEKIFTDSTIEEIENNKQAKIGRLKPADKSAIEFLCKTYWADIENFFINQFTFNKGAEVHRYKDGFLVVFSGDRNNFDAVTEATIKNRGKGRSLREKVFNQFIVDLQELLDELGLNRLKPTAGDKTGPLDYTSYFNLGHMGTTNADIALADKLNKGLNTQVQKVGNKLPEGGQRDFVRNRTLSGMKADINNVLVKAGYTVPPGKGEVVLISALAKLRNDTTSDITKTIVLTMESRAGNVSKADEQQARNRFLSALETAVLRKDAYEWANQEASDSVVTTVRKTLVRTAVKEGFKSANKADLAPVNKKKSTAKQEYSRSKKKTIIHNVVPKLNIRSMGNQQGSPLAVPSYFALIDLINERLPPKVRSNMGAPRLENQSGRLSESARVTNITPTPQGFPSIEYTYQRSPYDVFDKTKGKAPWNSPGRDPSELIALSVRQLATELGMQRFYTRRAQ